MIAEELKPWDGRTWFVRRPASYTPGLYLIHQIEARDLLKRSGRKLNEWEASFLQTVAYQCSRLTDAQEYWLRKIGEAHGSRVAA